MKEKIQRENSAEEKMLSQLEIFEKQRFHLFLWPFLIRHLQSEARVWSLGGDIKNVPTKSSSVPANAQASALRADILELSGAPP